jgi:hypothetical protein
MSEDRSKIEPPEAPPSGPRASSAVPFAATPANGAPEPFGSPQDSPDVPRPKPVDTAFWLYLAAAALGIVGLLVSIASYGAVRDDALRQLSEQGQGGVLSAEAIDAVVTATFVVDSVFAVIFTAGYVILANLMRRGMNWARIVLTVLAGLAVFGILADSGIGALEFVCLAAATVLVFLPASNAYFRAAAATRAARRTV